MTNTPTGDPFRSEVAPKPRRTPQQPDATGLDDDPAAPVGNARIALDVLANLDGAGPVTTADWKRSTGLKELHLPAVSWLVEHGWVIRTGSESRPRFMTTDRFDTLTVEADTAAKNQATALVELATDTYEFGVSTGNEVYGVPRTGPKVVALLRGGKTSLESQLAATYFDQHGSAASSSALADAMKVLEGQAQQRDEAELHLRVGHDPNGHIWIDLGDQTGRAVEITPDGWALRPEPPVLFRRTAVTRPLPDPAAGHTAGESPNPSVDMNDRFTDLWDLLNVATEDRPLVLAWLVATLFEGIPHPALNFTGEQGTGKTTAATILVSIADPSAAPVRKPPSDANSWVTAAAGSWVVAIDNLSKIQEWLSDSLCRAVTGDADVRRQLYTNGSLVVFSFRRSLILTGIGLDALADDLADRLLPVELTTIPDDQRMEAEAMTEAWTKAHPRILTALLDLTTQVLAIRNTIDLPTKPRMADFARILAAVDHLLGTNGLARYLDKRRSLATEGVTSDPFMVALMNLVIAQDDQTWQGTSTQLLNAVTKPDKEPDWPARAQSVTTKLTRWSPALRQTGWHITHTTTKNRSAEWTIAAPTEMCDAPPSQDGSEDDHLDHLSTSPLVRRDAEVGGHQDGRPPDGRSDHPDHHPEVVTHQPAEVTTHLPTPDHPAPTREKVVGWSRWSLPEPSCDERAAHKRATAPADDRGTCDGCGEPMIVVTPGFHWHPSCATRAAPRRPLKEGA